MKTVGQILRKVNQLRYRYLQHLLRHNLKPTPGNCVYNAVVPPARASASVSGEEVRSQEVRICLYGADSPGTWSASFCDERVDGGARARACDVFCPHSTKAELKEAFNEEFNSIGFSQLAAAYPDIAALLWVLDTQDLRANQDHIHALDGEDEADAPVQVVADSSGDTQPPVVVPVVPELMGEVVPASATPKNWLHKLFGV